MAESESWRELRVGIFAAIAIAAVAILVLLFARVGALRGDTFQLFVRVSSARGIMKGSDVWVGGQRVGRVTDVHFTPPAGADADPLVLELEVLRRHRQAIRDDSRTQIRAGTRLIAAPVVAIGPGTATSPIIDEGDTLRARAQPDVESLTSRFGAATKELPAVMGDVKRVNEQLRNPRGTIGAFGSERGAVELRAVRERGGRLAASLGQRGGTLGRLLNGRDQLIARSRVILARADSIQLLAMGPDAAIGRFRRDTTLKSVVADIQRELSEIQRLLDEAEGTAGRVQHDGAIVQSLQEAQREMAAIMADIKRRPFRYLNF